MIIVPTSPSKILCRNIGQKLNAKVAEKQVKRFPDGEMYVRIEDDIKGKDVVVVGSTRSDENLVEMLLTLNAAREASPRKLLAVFPYFGYSRQHRMYHPGEAISSKIMVQSLSLSVDGMYAVDLHDEESLEFTEKPFSNLKIVDSIGDHFRKHGVDFVVSPDDGGSERAEAVAQYLGIKSFYLDKVRIDSTTVQMKMPDVDVKGKNVLLVDDIISTGGTIMKCARIMKEHGASEVYISAVHGIFTGEAGTKIKEAADEVAVTDTLESEFSSISVAPEVSRAIMEAF